MKNERKINRRKPRKKKREVEKEDQNLKKEKIL